MKKSDAGRKILLGLVILVGLGAAAPAAAQVLPWNLTWEHYMASAKRAFAQGNGPEAERLLNGALKQAQKFKSTDYRLAITYTNLAMLYQNQQKFAKAETFYTKSLNLKRRTLPPDDPSIARDLNNLATMQVAQGKYGEAGELLREAVAINVKSLGQDHLSVAANLANLASLYAVQGKLAEAESSYQKALAIREKALGPNHQEVALTLVNLAQVYRSQKQDAMAEPLLKRAAAIMGVENKGPAPPAGTPQKVAATTAPAAEPKVLAENYELINKKPPAREPEAAPPKKSSWLDIRRVGKAIFGIFR